MGVVHECGVLCASGGVVCEWGVVCGVLCVGCCMRVWVLCVWGGVCKWGCCVQGGVLCASGGVVCKWGCCVQVGVLCSSGGANAHFRRFSVWQHRSRLLVIKNAALMPFFPLLPILHA